MISRLKSFLSDFEVIAIDDFRIRYGDGSMEAELLSKRYFFESIVENKNQIIEAMGIGDTGMQLRDMLSTFEDWSVVVILRTPLDVCIERLKKREWNVPYPAPPEKAFVLAEIADEQIASGNLSVLWKTVCHSIVCETNDYEEIVSTIFNKKKNSHDKG